MAVARPIYEPRGAAREYAPLAVNLYRGCTHGCRYCYAPACLKMPAAEFHAAAAPRCGILDALRRQAMYCRAQGPVLLCFTCDPYQPAEDALGVTRRAIRLLGDCGLPVRILTKRPRLAAARDGDLLTEYGVDCGVSLAWQSDAKRRRWEPRAGTVSDRLDFLTWAAERNLPLWVSVEPVIQVNEALGAVRAAAALGARVMLGKLNHDRARESRIDWAAYLAEALKIVTEASAAYYVKSALWRYAPEHIRQAVPQMVGEHRV